ncbi:hypothetical protein B0T26DRAFT_729056 [Lasiosphaeria miniovina]|uniref:Uncharacterized protein n=1 Tax=Lasiosphaeria miniovina TaxID=1954250 RepID=A0AA40A0L3_9PEZI|nr:uncharacterized protein B0T26DRAFT_729056 [Lasiosphaeria miniovina]KAK0707068.1 hypothetical protein B0T26DRAFT_729056 [Lasiosphaeria miniovina]
MKNSKPSFRANMLLLSMRLRRVSRRAFQNSGQEFNRSNVEPIWVASWRRWKEVLMPVQTKITWAVQGAICFTRMPLVIPVASRSVGISSSKVTLCVMFGMEPIHSFSFSALGSSPHPAASTSCRAIVVFKIHHSRSSRGDTAAMVVVWTSAVSVGALLRGTLSAKSMASLITSLVKVQKPRIVVGGGESRSLDSGMRNLVFNGGWIGVAASSIVAVACKEARR